MRRVAMGLIRLYQLTLSQLLPSSCQYLPSCSQYGYEAYAKYGVFRGTWMTAWRIARCNPWSKGGYDPVP